MNYYSTNARNIKPGFYVPVNLRPSLIPRGQRQFAAYFLNLLHWKWLCWQADERGFIRLKQEYITRIILPEVWPEIRDRLWGKGVIHWDSTWTPGKRSQGYRLAPEFRKTRRIPCTSASLARRIQRVYAAESVPLVPVHRWLEGKLNLLRIDVERAHGVISTMKPDKGSAMPVDEYHSLLVETCKRIDTAAHWFVCDRFGRVHTPLTALAKKLRCCLSVNGQPLVGLDLANSQPLIAGLVARQFYRNGKTAMRLRARSFRRGSNPYHRRHPRPNESDTGRPDLKRYIEVCESGQLYESLMRPGDERDRIKTGFLTAMYGKNRWRDRIKDRLTEGYPSVAFMLASLKKRNHRHAAHVIQNAEATIFVHGIADRIRRERPDYPIFTIHDSVLTMPDNVDYVRTVTMDEFSKLNVHPTLHEEREEQ